MNDNLSTEPRIRIGGENYTITAPMVPLDNDATPKTTVRWMLRLDGTYALQQWHPQGEAVGSWVDIECVKEEKAREDSGENTFYKIGNLIILPFEAGISNHCGSCGVIGRVVVLKMGTEAISLCPECRAALCNTITTVRS